AEGPAGRSVVARLPVRRRGLPDTGKEQVRQGARMSTLTVRPRRLSSRAAHPYLLISPAVVLVAIFLVYPVITVFWESLRRHNLTRPLDDGFAGLDNYRAMLSDDLFWRSLRFTGQWVLVEVGLQFVLGLALALLLNRTFVGRGMARAL